jgi:hypothetical protein
MATKQASKAPPKAESKAPADPQPESKQEAPRAPEAPSPPEPGYDAGRVWRRRTDDDVLSGEFCRVVHGPHTGRYGVFAEVAEVDNGWPSLVVVKTRDDQDEPILVPYGFIRPDVPGKR